MSNRAKCITQIIDCIIDKKVNMQSLFIVKRFITYNIQVAQLWPLTFTKKCMQNICSASFSLVTIHACDRRTDGQTDRQTDGQDYDFQDRPRICSRSKNAI